MDFFRRVFGDHIIKLNAGKQLKIVVAENKHTTGKLFRLNALVKDDNFNEICDMMNVDVYFCRHFFTNRSSIEEYLT